MAGDDSWAALPSLVVVEIFSYLPKRSRLSVSTCCKSWRASIFHPKLWKNLSINVTQDMLTGQHVGSDPDHVYQLCGRFAQHVNINLQKISKESIPELIKIFETLSRNKNIKSLIIRPTSCQLEWNDENQIDRIMACVIHIIKNANGFVALSLGCIEELCDHADEIVAQLANQHSKSLKLLQLASVKENPLNYGLLNLPYNLFHDLVALEELSIDYDYVTEGLLHAFCCSGRVQLKKLTLHVYGLSEGYNPISNKMWEEVVIANPNIEVSLNLVHSEEGSLYLGELLQPAMPLVHLRQYFCQFLNLPAIEFIALHMSEKFRTLVVVDGMVNFEPNDDNLTWVDESPFVMLAWKCPHLRELTFIGYVISEEDVIAIARLRGAQLMKLNIASCCVAFTSSEDQQSLCFKSEISSCLGRPWEAIRDEQLHPAVTDAEADAETLYLSQLLDV